MERGCVMFGHSVFIGIFLYAFMRFVFKQKPEVAEDRSILLGSFVLIYMVLFGHRLPSYSINRNIIDPKDF